MHTLEKHLSLLSLTFLSARFPKAHPPYLLSLSCCVHSQPHTPSNVTSTSACSYIQLTQRSLVKQFPISTHFWDVFVRIMWKPVSEAIRLSTGNAIVFSSYRLMIPTPTTFYQTMHDVDQGGLTISQKHVSTITPRLSFLSWSHPCTQRQGCTHCSV